jgi:hypothetical protein
MEIAEPEESGRSNAVGSPVEDDSASSSDIDSTTASTVLVEVLPGVALVAGEVPPELKPDLIDFGIVPAADRKQISAVLASMVSQPALRPWHQIGLSPGRAGLGQGSADRSGGRLATDITFCDTCV